MSNIYIQEPPTDGKILIVTSLGDFDIELWSKEAPKACHNFLQLCMEGYYNGTTFHRVIKGFIAQGGDPTGTGEGGESIYVKPFKDEFHSRLRFVRRGLVAMANAGPNGNGSQFFFTLDACQELQNKHTIFGKITGDTDDRPIYPVKIIKTEILSNPFPNIVPRQIVKNESESESKKAKEEKKGTKNFNLLSFGDEAEEDEEEFVLATRNFSVTGNSAHDIAMDPTLSCDSAVVDKDEIERIKKKLKTEKPHIPEEDIKPLPATEEESQEKQDEKLRKLAEMKAEIRKLKKELVGNKSSKEDNKDDNENKETEEGEALRAFKKEIERFEDARKNLPKKGSSREVMTLALLNRFHNKVFEAVNNADSEDNKDDDKHITEGGGDEDESWLHHRLIFEEQVSTLAKDASSKDSNWYEVTDPRNAMVQRRREKISKK